jgi:hypothetical protein
MTNGLGYFALAVLLLLCLAALPWLIGYTGQYLWFVWCHFHQMSDLCQ